MLPLALRNLVADSALSSLADGARDPVFAALEVFAACCDESGVARLSGEAFDTLAAAGAPFRVMGEGVAVERACVSALEDLRRAMNDLGAVLTGHGCGRAPFDWRERPILPVPGAPAPGDAEIRWSLCAASALFNHRRYFEVHEVIEACWLRTRGDLYEFLKGLIQVAVGFYHHENGNLVGARALLAEGLDRVTRFSHAFPELDLGEFCATVRTCSDAVNAGRPLDRLPVFPACRP